MVTRQKLIDEADISPGNTPRVLVIRPQEGLSFLGHPYITLWLISRFFNDECSHASSGIHAVDEVFGAGESRCRDEL